VNDQQPRTKEAANMSNDTERSVASAGSHFDRAAEDHAMSRGWMPHKPETWPHRYATLKRDVAMLHLRDSKEVEISVPAGSTVKLVMVSRFGDVGVTEDLTAENGYGVRLPLCDLCDWRDEP
jgi:hypothetical protein